VRGNRFNENRGIQVGRGCADSSGAELQTGKTVGYEALSRFGAGTPDVWFADATRAGLGAELELKAIRRGLEQLDALYELLARHPGDRIVIELTEQAPIDDYP